ncbi:MAG: DUF2920 family protein [Roseburia sp.]
MGKEILEDLYEELKVIGKLPQGTILECEQKTGETEKEFNDMGVMQALDIVNATLSVIYYLQEQYSSVNTKKVILFGSSHGAYLAHLANLICPRLYASVLDISGYLKPYFLDHIRDVIVRSGDVRVIVKFRYFLHQHPEYRYHNDLYDLRFLYKNRNNTCKIIAFHGKDDRMVDYREREAFIGQLDSAEMLLIDRGDVDGTLFGNARHSLETNFFVLFDMLMPMLDSILREHSEEVKLEKGVVLGDAHAFIKISYEGGLPMLEEIVFGEAGRLPGQHRG